MRGGGVQNGTFRKAPHPKQGLRWEPAGTGLLVASTLLGHSDSHIS